ncbi:hypothetical protein [Nonomuraea sp. SYSU D8015]|uniref:hypothetical protein n=1 Tax=Nonomuraea sp. SYSU D8015 TaxID=2593644 RepID=UPI00166032AC|nr:hypothetical protein [Nonomuraea sp. SYSU D8015]
MWFWLWLLFVILVLVVPLGYGMGYRRWSMPYPGFFRRYLPAQVRPDYRPGERQDDALAYHRESAADRRGKNEWGLMADLLWLALVVAVVWLVIGLLW